MILNLFDGFLCVSQLHGFILKSTSDLFKAYRGLHQGCPLSPFLYIIMVYSLSRKLDSETILDRLLGIIFSRGVNSINNYHFIDDTPCMGGASSIISRRFKTILDHYLEASDGMMNWGKSEIYSQNISVRKQQQITRILGFQIVESYKEFKYLSIPISLKGHLAQAWVNIITKFKTTFS